MQGLCSLVSPAQESEVEHKEIVSNRECTGDTHLQGHEAQYQF